MKKRKFHPKVFETVPCGKTWIYPSYSRNEKHDKYYLCKKMPQYVPAKTAKQRIRNALMDRLKKDRYLAIRRHAAFNTIPRIKYRLLPIRNGKFVYTRDLPRPPLVSTIKPLRYFNDLEHYRIV